jgi:hypothetical protein
MNASTIKKYEHKTVAQLKNKAKELVHKWVRNRDEDGCISCGSYNEIQAGHFYSAGHHNNLRFEPDNIWRQCKKCNYFLSGNLNDYLKNLIKKIGIERVERLDMLAASRDAHKDDRFFLIEIIEKYKNK